MFHTTNVRNMKQNNAIQLSPLKNPNATQCNIIINSSIFLHKIKIDGQDSVLTFKVYFCVGMTT